MEKKELKGVGGLKTYSYTSPEGMGIQSRNDEPYTGIGIFFLRSKRTGNGEKF